MHIKDARHVYGVKDKAGWDRRVRATLGQAGLVVVPQTEPVSAYVSDNRWVADCGNCGSGIGVWDRYPRATCLECGHDWPVRFPAGRDRAVTLLLARPPQHRHWLPGETVEDLQAENDVMVGEGA